MVVQRETCVVRSSWFNHGEVRREIKSLADHLQTGMPIIGYCELFTKDSYLRN